MLASPDALAPSETLMLGDGGRLLRRKNVGPGKIERWRRWSCDEADWL